MATEKYTRYCCNCGGQLAWVQGLGVHSGEEVIAPDGTKGMCHHSCTKEVTRRKGYKIAASIANSPMKVALEKAMSQQPTQQKPAQPVQPAHQSSMQRPVEDAISVLKQFKGATAGPSLRTPDSNILYKGIWLWIAAHPDRHAANISSELELENLLVQHVLHEMASRNMVVRQKQETTVKPYSNRSIWHYRVNPELKEYRVLPMPDAEKQRRKERDAATHSLKVARAVAKALREKAAPVAEPVQPPPAPPPAPEPPPVEVPPTMDLGAVTLYPALRPAPGHDIPLATEVVSEVKNLALLESQGWKLKELKALYNELTEAFQ